MRIRAMAIILAGCAMFSVQSSSAQNLIYSADMTDSTGWQRLEVGTGGTFSTWNFDYSTLGIPEAPNTNTGDTATRGLQLKANVDVSFDDDQIIEIYEDAAFTGQYTVQVDAWINWAADAAAIGTTEHGGVFVGSAAAGADPLKPALNGAGVTWTGDGGCFNCDYILNKDGAELDLFSGQYSVMDFGFGNQPGFNQNDGDIEMIFPSFDLNAATNNMQNIPAGNTQPAGAAGFQWVVVTAEVDTNAVGNGTNGSLGTAKFTITNAASGESLVVGTVDNSVDDDPNDGFDTGEMPANMDGGIGLMIVDFFTSNASDPDLAFALFDNVRVFDGFLTTLDCDFDGSETCDVADLDMLGAEVIAGTNGSAFDLTGDGMVNNADRDAWLAQAATENGFSEAYQLGDVDLNGVVDGPDFVVWNNNKFDAPGATTPWSDADFNFDNNVDGQDFVLWNNNKFDPISDGVGAVPEPSVGLIWLAAGLMWFGRRRVR